MNKRQILASLYEIANELDNYHLYKEAQSITDTMIKLSQNVNYDTIFDSKIERSGDPEIDAEEYFRWYRDHMLHAFEYKNYKEALALYKAGKKKNFNSENRAEFEQFFNDGKAGVQNWNVNSNPDQLATVNSAPPTQQSQQPAQRPQQLTQKQQRSQSPAQRPQNIPGQSAQQWINQTSQQLGGDVMQIYQLASQLKINAQNPAEKKKYNDAMYILQSHPNFKPSIDI